MVSSQEKYFEEREKYAHVEIVLGSYILEATGEEIEIEGIEGDKATILNKNTGWRKTKTLHWCRKKLVKK